jgi:hypothetical protein
MTDYSQVRLRQNGHAESEIPIKEDIDDKKKVYIWFSRTIRC